MLVFRSAAVVALALSLAACGQSSERTGFIDGKPVGDSAAPTPTGDFDKTPPTGPVDAPEVHEVYGHSGTTLYKLEPKTKSVTVVGTFKDCGSIIDIALDEKSTMYGVSVDKLYVIDKTTAVCSEPRSGKFPNSLSFVPKGTVDANEEALVGYDGGDYIRIDIKTGARTSLGKLDGKLVSSGDIVSVKDGATYLTVKGGSCTTNDCLIEVDPATGKLLKDWGSIEHRKVFGLSFWGGKVYGFDEAGNLFEVTFGTNSITTTSITIPAKPTDLSFWGAGSSTSAPLLVDPQ